MHPDPDFHSLDGVPNKSSWLEMRLKSERPISDFRCAVSPLGNALKPSSLIYLLGYTAHICYILSRFFCSILCRFHNDTSILIARSGNSCRCYNIHLRLQSSDHYGARRPSYDAAANPAERRVIGLPAI